MYSMENQLSKYKYLSQQIEKKIKENRLEEAQKQVEEYEKKIKNYSLYSYRAIIAFKRGKIDLAIKILLEGLRNNPFSFELYHNLGFMYGMKHEVIDALKNYFYAAKFSLTEDEKKIAFDGIQEVSEIAIKNNFLTLQQVKEKLKQFEKLFNQYDARVYPIDIHGSSIIRKPQQVGTENEHIVNMYKTLSYTNIDIKTRMIFKSELIKGNVLKDRRVFDTSGPIILPISKIIKDTRIIIKVNDETFVFEKGKLPINQIHYLRINDYGKVEISSEEEIFIGEPIFLDTPKKPVKLVMKIFIDGLSYQFLEEVGLEKAMPNTYNFFKKGFISTNCNSTNEWTLPSKAGINTGLYANNHLLLHPNHLCKFPETTKMLTELFHDTGYFCTNISGSWRSTPSLGYYRGYNRMIYQNFLGGFDGKEVIMETIEHLSAFRDNNNFITLSLSDLHNVPDEIESHLYSQVYTDIIDRINENKKGSTSVQTKYDKKKISKYFMEIKRIDMLLDVLYDFIEKYYESDEILIVMHSDHGQSFLDDTFNLLGDQRIRVPFMMRGKNVPTVISDELIETIDIFPAMLHCCSIDIPTDINGCLPKILGGNSEREFTFSQIIHPNQTYKVRLKEKDISYYLETPSEVYSNLTINLEGFQSKIIDNNSGKEVTDKYNEKKEQYDKYVFEQVKNMLRWSN